MDGGEDQCASSRWVLCCLMSCVVCKRGSVCVRARLCACVAGIGILLAAPAEAKVFKVLGPQQPARCAWGAGHRGRLRERRAQQRLQRTGGVVKRKSRT